ncbi:MULTISPECIES: mycofactocin biosynthesis peptidyl-dipeptidase MftE [Nocardia]|uniref:mycofactocin biosynthesis peptidyl-dipeptidase MftE n=1 Tax=Nocardia TaxID=1817 RepID=UPI0007A4041A|nr:MULTISPECIES: mycofactocin biosynthesis peptidyl-dipeptidase MftE [Nocardia]OBF71440.1 mycofactocin system creatininase family protein [Mycobacterium sp. 852002-51759_SCH5129042]MBF6273389.1 mycofactocin biosynthesis peptidyl-dipeptidase MftE [Nocardia nova]MBV7704361.1 mycofactocin biosynthesis peptidyl-dipeptidase MftE [Nocardia nova]OBA54548.1 mycofactocin system creatininase family protein [Nocardia sp. 852002-51101_SCH5132738]OBB36479.1 mycofactocin system creatininase family protein [
MRLADLTSADLAEADRAPLLAIPLGATEQHGPHLPLGTDTTVAVELCRRLVATRPDIVAAPEIPYGSSGEHAGFPGTLSIGHRALELLIVELVRSADEFAGVILVNGHGGNLEPLRAAQRLLTAEGRSTLVWSPTGPADDTHAGHGETSVMLHLTPARVTMHRAEPGATRPLRELMPRLRSGGVKAVSANGILGDPTTADAAEGARILDRWAGALIAAVAERFPEPR